MKYKIEGNFNFYDELYKSLDEPLNVTDNNDNDICLITKQPLSDNFITMECKHKFNYDPLYKEIYNQKCKLRLYNEIHLSSNMRDVYIKSGKDYFIICPYCRNIQFELLPYLDNDIYPKVYGINTNDRSYIRVTDKNANGYIYKGFFYNLSKVNKCIHDGCVSTVCAFNDDFQMFCCSTHMSSEIVKRKTQLKIQAQEKKLKIKEEKQKIKEEKAKIREENAKIKEENIKIKKDKQGIIKKEKVVNSVIGANNQINEYIPPNENAIVYTCYAILKSGLNKGQPCGSNIFCEGLCKRHFKSKPLIQNTSNKLELIDLDKIDDNNLLE